MQCDYYAATIPDSFYNISGYLTNNLGGVVVPAKSGLNGYKHRAFINNESSGDTLATVLFGGNNGANPHVFASSSAAIDLRNLTREIWDDHIVTRIDVCEDMNQKGLFEELQGKLVPIAKKNRVSVCVVGDWLSDDAEQGRTLYIGSKTSPTRIRLYEKGKEIAQKMFISRGFGIPENFPLDWVRLELQLRPQKSQREVAARDNLENMWGYSSWTQEVASCALDLEVEKVDGRKWTQTNTERAFSWIAQQYGNMLLSRKKALGSWEAIGAELGRYVEERRKFKLGKQ